MNVLFVLCWLCLDINMPIRAAALHTTTRKPAKLISVGLLSDQLSNETERKYLFFIVEKS
jgi:hypothetical protein